MALKLDSIICRNETNFLSNPVGDEIIILNMETGDYLGLNAVGASIWQQLQESRTVQQIINTLMTEYEIDPKTCSDETFSYLDKLAQLGLLNMDA